ncbi:MAG: ribosome recycling factor [Campylobacteraceae bacterium]|jgi:ribosome recycling factor|nr:ribosome recycling factor [Campylobacteraceae bacterium]
MLEEIYSFANDGMNKALESLKRDFGTIRSGKVSLSILDNIKVDYYGSPTPLNGVANLATPDATTITITPWEKSMLKEIEKAIQIANIGVNPGNNGESVILSFPPMTMDQRKENAKKAKAFGENAKVAIRNIRRDANDKVKKLEKEKAISEDDSKRGQEKIQKITDDFVAKVDSMCEQKEAELLKV